MTTSSVHYRDLTEDDAAAALGLLAGASPAPRRTPGEPTVAGAWRAPGAGIAAVDDGGALAALATLQLTPSIYTGGDWAHLEDCVVRAGDEEGLAPQLLAHVVAEMTRRGFPHMSVGLPPGQEWLVPPARAAGFTDELTYMGRSRLGDVRSAPLPQATVRGACVAGAASADACAADAGALGRLVAAFADEFGHPSAADATTVAAFLDRPDTGCLIAEHEGRAVGFIATSAPFSLHYGGPTVMIDDLVVLPERRRRGIARALVERALEDAAAHRCTVARLWMKPDDAVARGFYESLGFTECGRVLMTPAED
jgi:ribosomal protein S18 acetylase RimI-like enzyme